MASAESERNKSEAMSAFLQELLREVNPGPEAPQVTIRDVLDAAEVEAAQPDLDPELREALELVIRRARAKLDAKK